MSLPPDQPAPQGYFTPDPVDYQTFVQKKVPAGICGILLGGLGVHKFILGYTNAGIIMLSISLVCVITSCFVFPILGNMAIGVIGIIEGIIYLTKSDPEFYQTYRMQRKEWF